MSSEAQTKDALLVVHDVWGPSASLNNTAKRIASALGAKFFVRDYLGRRVPPGTSNGDAYLRFMQEVGVDGLASRVLEDSIALRTVHGRVWGLGLSVGASATWIAAAAGAFDASVCVYGSRIRDHAEEPPRAPCLALFAGKEASFDPNLLVRSIAAHPTVTAVVVGGEHGFCNPRTDAYDRELAQEVERRATEFLRANAS